MQFCATLYLLVVSCLGGFCREETRWLLSWLSCSHEAGQFGTRRCEYIRKNLDSTHVLNFLHHGVNRIVCRQKVEVFIITRFTTEGKSRSDSSMPAS